MIRAEQQIFRAKALNDLQVALGNRSSILGYLAPEFVNSDPKTISFHFDSHGVAPVLDASQPDFENARLLFEYYRHLTPIQASDPRLWGFLCHRTHRRYVQERWSDLEKLLTPNTDEALETAGRYVLEKWFTGSGARSLRRNSLAGLWWPTYLTAMPSDGWSQDYDFLHADDEYCYTRMLFEKTDLQLNLLDRRTGWSRKILLPILEVLRQKPNILASRAKYRPFIIEFSLMMSYRKIGSMVPRKILDTGLTLAEQLESGN